MVPSKGKFVIYQNGRHGSAAYTYSVENALKLVLDAAAAHPDLLVLESAVDADLSGEGPALRSYSWLTNALEELQALPPGEPMPMMRIVMHGGAPRKGDDPRPVVLCQEAWRNELAIWCFNREIAPKKIAEAIEVLPSQNPWEAFSFLADAQARFPRGVRLVSNYYLTGAEELRVLRRNCWKEQATEDSVIPRYVRFLNEWGSGRWDILAVQEA